MDIKSYLIFIPIVFCAHLVQSQDDTTEKIELTPWWETQEQEFIRPSAQTLIKTLIQKNPNNKHPRLLINPGLISQIHEARKTDKFMKAAYEDVLSQADQILQEPTQKTFISRHTTVDRIFPLGLAWHLTKEKKYFDRAWVEMESVAAANVWHTPKNKDFLNVAYTVRGMALGYDWFYNDMTSEQRKTIRESIIQKALKPGQFSYRHPNTREFGQAHWIKGKHNWNPTCNGSLAIAALVLGDEVPKLAGEILEKGLLSVENYLTEFAPDGAWKEGVGYWYWATASLVLYVASLESALDTDYNISTAQGFDQTGYFPVYMEGTEGVFNYADSPVTSRLSPEILFLANRSNDKTLASTYRTLVLAKNRTLRARDILYSNFTSPVAGYGINLPLSRSFGRVEGFSFRESWFDTTGVFVACKGGYNSEVHGTLSTGTFVLDAKGVRWAHQIGAGNYSGKDGFWDYRENGRRWTFYRCRAEGQNSIVLNPDSFPDQYPNAISKLIRYKNNKNVPGGFGIIDMQEAYQKNAISAQRGIYMSTDASYVLIQDEMTFHKPSDAYWFMHTKANVNISSDGKSALLSQGGKSISLELVTDADDSKFVVMPARKLPTSPDPDRIIPEKDNDAFQKLSVVTRNVNKLNQAVIFNISNSKTNFKWTQLENWELDK